MAAVSDIYYFAMDEGESVMKWYDKYFLAFLVIGLLSAIIVPIKVYEYSPPAAYVGLIMSLAITIGVLLDWKNFRRRHNL